MVRIDANLFFCGEKGEKKKLDVREWTCACGAHHDRDINASLNLLMLAD